MGLTNSFIGLGGIFGPLWGGLAFDLHWGLPILSGALVMVLGFFGSLRAIPVQDPAANSGQDTTWPLDGARQQME